MNFIALKNQSESWRSPGNLFLKKGMNPELTLIPVAATILTTQVVLKDNAFQRINRYPADCTLFS